MVSAQIPPNEAQRLAALKSYNILDTASEQCFDDLTALASFICGSPIALISLVDGSRQWFKSKVGISDDETSRDVSFCAHAILAPDEFTVEDAHQDPRFADNPLVTGQPMIGFYAGVPLTNPQGFALGTLCVIDRKPRQLSRDQYLSLRALSRQVMHTMEMKRVNTELAEALKKMSA